MDEQITKIFKDLGPFNTQLDQTIKKITELNSGILNNSKAFDVDFKGAISGAIKTFDTFYTSGEGVGKSLKASFKDFNATVDKSRDSLKEVSKGLSNTEKASVGITGAIEIFTSFKDVLYDLVSGNKDAGDAFVALIPVLASVGVAMYAALGPVGLIIGALAAIGGAIFGLAQAAQEAAIEVLFDNVGISAETLSATLDTVGGSVIEQNEKFNKFAEDLAELGNQYSELRETFEIESLLISDSTTATEDSFKKFDETRLAMAENVKQQLTDTTDMAIKAYREMVTQNGQEMTEEQKSVLLKMQENKTAKMAEIDAINTEINKITQNGLNTRGHLIDEEKRKIDELYKKQEELANFSAKLEQRKQSQMLDDIRTGKIQLNLGNYEQYLKSIPEQATKAQQAALDNYINQLALFDATLNTPDTQEQYKKSIFTAKTAYEKALSQIKIDQNNLIESITSQLEGKKDSSSGWFASAENKELEKYIEKFNDIKVDISNGSFGGGSIRAWASGGIPDYGELFIAREAGPELVGSFGARTAVMNNNQIVDSVASGVYGAVKSAMASSAGGNGNVNIIAEGDVSQIIKFFKFKLDRENIIQGKAAVIL